MGREKPRFKDLFDERLLSSYESASLERQLKEARRQVGRLIDVSRTLKRPTLGGPGPSDADGGDSSMLQLLLQEVLENQQQQRRGLKARVARRMVDEVSRFYLWTSLSTLPVFHELTVLVPWWAINRAQHLRLREAADAMVGETLSGIVLSLQRVREEVLTADEVHLAHCACRSSGIAHDLEQEGQVFNLLGPTESRLLLDRLVDRYEALGDDRLRQGTNARFRGTMDRLVELRREESTDYRLETFLADSYSQWEILPVRRGYTTNWVRSLQTNDKCAPVDRELIFEMLNIFFHARGAIFNSMKCVNSQYTICTCPTPENEGGCALTNWYYYGQLNNSLLPADDHYGRLRDRQGKVLPCRFFPMRARRECIGCGCNHALASPRDLATSLAEADALHARYLAGDLPAA